MRIALSGGGYPAMLLHLGALWKLNQAGELAKLTNFSSVSGGSITAGVLAPNWTKLQFERSDPVGAVALNFRALIADPQEGLASRTLTGVWVSVAPFRFIRRRRPSNRCTEAPVWQSQTG